MNKDVIPSIMRDLVEKRKNSPRKSNSKSVNMIFSSSQSKRKANINKNEESGIMLKFQNRSISNIKHNLRDPVTVTHK